MQIFTKDGWKPLVSTNKCNPLTLLERPKTLFGTQEVQSGGAYNPTDKVFSSSEEDFEVIYESGSLPEDVINEGRD